MKGKQKTQRSQFITLYVRCKSRRMSWDGYVGQLCKNIKFFMQKFLETDHEGLLVLLMNSEVNKCIVLQWLNTYWLSVKYLLLGSQFPVCLIVSVSQYSHHILSMYIGGVSRNLLTPPMKMEQTECSKTSAYKIQMPGNHQKEEYNIQNKAKVWNQE